MFSEISQGLETAATRLKKAIETRAFVTTDQERIFETRGREKSEGWLFDLRRILLDANVLEDIGTVFWQTFRSSYPFQIGGVETAAIPLVTSLVMHGYLKEDTRDVTGFFLRKSRKKTGLTRMIEGEIVPGRPIILVDDLTNSGNSLQRQVEVLESLGHRVAAVWVLIRFRDAEYYQYFMKKGIAVYSVFELNDFSNTLNVRNLEKRSRPPLAQPFEVLWKFASPNPSYHYVVPKSDPALDEERVYFGSDTGVMWALNQSDGSIAWSKKIGLHVKGKGIFSSPAMHGGIVYFGGYDGNIYALEAATGKTRWVSFEADWVGSSPALAPDIGLVFIGLEYGLWRKRGGIAALDMATGKTKWAFRDMPCYTHSSPLYIPSRHQVVIGSNDGCAYLFDALTGALIWKASPGALSERELNSGFSKFDIKESFAYNEKRDHILFGNVAGDLYALERATGKLVHHFSAAYGFNSTPLVSGDSVFAASLDKNLYCLDLDTFKEKWHWYGGARIFASPVAVNDSIFIGTNTGRLTELDPGTGRELSSIQLTERITNKPVYNARTRRFFVPTYANELYCVERKDLIGRFLER